LIESFGAKLTVPELLAVEEIPVSDGEEGNTMDRKNKKRWKNHEIEAEDEEEWI
jgi:hypothetical protein